jgi:hypothetical protein
MHTTADTDLINQLATAVAKQIKPSIPLEIDLWDISTIAAYFKRSEAQVRERMACLPDFPKAIRLPSSTGARGQALYPAQEVISWAKKYRDKN